jgi:hypothetical protein
MMLVAARSVAVSLIPSRYYLPSRDREGAVLGP